MRSETLALPNDGSDDMRPNTKRTRSEADDGIAHAIDVSAEPKAARESVFPSESADTANVSPFPTEVKTPPESTPHLHRAPAVAQRDEVQRDAAHREAAKDATTAQRQVRNWRTILLALLGVAVLTQAVVMGYWLMARGGFAALTTQTGSITVTSEPLGSQVEIDGAVRGRTPLTIALPAGAHAVVVGTGEQARSQNVRVTRGGDASMHVQLPAVIAAPAAASKTALQVATEPPGARVWIDGEWRGVSPLTVSNLTAGDHAVTVRGGAAGDPINRTVTLQQGATASLVITMPANGGSFASGWVSIQTPLPLQVLEKGALLGTTDMPKIMLTAGEHELELVNAPLGFRATRKITIAAGQTAAFSVIPPRGTLSINALPWAEVWIDGVRVGETPIGNYSIPIGTHEVVFRHPELGEQHKTVAVSAQGPVRVGVDMKKP